MKKASLYSNSLLLFSLVVGLFGLFRCAPTLPQAPTDGSLQGDASVVGKPMETTPKGKCVPNQLLKEYGRVNLTQYKESDYTYMPPSISSDFTKVLYPMRDGLLFLRNLEPLREKNVLLKSCATKKICGARRTFSNPNGNLTAVTIEVREKYLFNVSNLTYNGYSIEEFHNNGTSLNTYTYPKQKELTPRFQTRAHIAYSEHGQELAATIGIQQHPGDSTKYVPYKHLVDLVVWNTKSQTKKYTVKIKPMAVYGDIVFSKDKKYIAVAHFPNALSVYDSRTGKHLYRYQRAKHSGMLKYNWRNIFISLAFHPKNSSIIAFLSLEQCDLTIMDFQTQTIIKRLPFPFMTQEGYDKNQTCRSRIVGLKLAFSPDGSWLIASHAVRRKLQGRNSQIDIFLWETKNYQKSWILRLPKSPQFYGVDLQWSKDSQQFLASSTLHSWLFGCKK